MIYMRQMYLASIRYSNIASWYHIDHIPFWSYLIIGRDKHGRQNYILISYILNSRINVFVLFPFIHIPCQIFLRITLIRHTFVPLPTACIGEISMHKNKALFVCWSWTPTSMARGCWSSSQSNNWKVKFWEFWKREDKNLKLFLIWY